MSLSVCVSVCVCFLTLAYKSSGALICLIFPDYSMCGISRLNKLGSCSRAGARIKNANKLENADYPLLYPWNVNIYADDSFTADELAVNTMNAKSLLSFNSME